MEYILGLLSGVVFFVVIGIALYIGYRIGRQKANSVPLEDEQVRQKRERFDKHFKDLFSYDVDTALQRKKVTDE